MITSGDAANVETITPTLIRQVAKENFNTVRPFINAIRDNDLETLRQFEDLIGSGQWFLDQLQRLGEPEAEPLHDYAHGAATLPPMVTEDGIKMSVVNGILEGLGVSVKDREAIVARHRKMIEVGDVSGLVSVTRTKLSALKAGGKVGKRKLKEQPPTHEDDLRGKLSGVKEVGDVEVAAGAVTLEDALR